MHHQGLFFDRSWIPSAGKLVLLPLSFFIRESSWLLLLDDVPVSEAVLHFRSES